MKRKYEIDGRDLFELIKSQMILAALERAGVDNWEDYGINFEDDQEEWCKHIGLTYDPDIDYDTLAKEYLKIAFKEIK